MISKRHLTLLATCPVTWSAASASIFGTRFNGTTWDDELWRITTTNLDQGHYQSRMSLANGYLGISVAAVGPFFEVDVPVDRVDINGWPLFNRRQTFATVSGFYDRQPRTAGTNFEWLDQYVGESVISGVPHWSGLYVQVGGNLLNASVPSDQISNFSSSLDIKAAVMRWVYTWTPPSVGIPIHVEYEMFVHKLHVNQAAVQLKLTSEENLNATVIDVLDGDCAVRSNFLGKGYDTKNPSIWTAVKANGTETEFHVHSILFGDKSCHPEGRSQFSIGAVIGSNGSSIGQAMHISLHPHQVATFTKYIGAASSTAFANAKSVSRAAALKAARTGYERMLASHSAEWTTILHEESVDSFRTPNGSLPDDANIVELQILAVTNPFQLLQHTIGSNAIAATDSDSELDVNSISVCGLGSDCYAGFVFWDAEVWMAPGLVVAFPQAAKQIANYRVEKFPQAQANVATAYQSSKNMTSFSPNAAVYPWTSGGVGDCTATGPCFDYEYHINGDIGLEIYNYYVVTGDTEFFQSQLFPIYDAIAQFYVDLVTFNRTTEQYDLYNATDPDEYANFKTDPGYTAVLMQTHINMANLLRQRFGMMPNASWSAIANAITIPVNKDAGIILEYTGMDGSISVKQADVVLVDDFLDFPNPYTVSDLDYYAGKQSPDGPGMTYGVFSIVANQFSPSGCSSYTYDLYGSQPYLRGPWFQYSEQLIDNYQENGGTYPAFPFLTGVGGANRVAVFGYLGLRLMLDTLSVNPSLPPQIPQLTYRTIYWQGWPIKARSNQTHTVLTRTEQALANANPAFADRAIPVTIGINSTIRHDLAPAGSLTILNRPVGRSRTVPGNIAQCLPIASEQQVVPGQIALAAVDGAASTKWQPLYANETSSLTVSLTRPFVPVTRILLDWAQAPPRSFRMTFHNLSDTSDVPLVNVVSDSNVVISRPYNPATADDVVPYTSNQTDVTLARPIWSAFYATLEIFGNQMGPNETSGATVAEWAIVADSGLDLVRQ